MKTELCIAISSACEAEESICTLEIVRGLDCNFAYSRRHARCTGMRCACRLSSNNELPQPCHGSVLARVTPTPDESITRAVSRDERAFWYEVRLRLLYTHPRVEACKAGIRLSVSQLEFPVSCGRCLSLCHASLALGASISVSKLSGSYVVITNSANPFVN